MKFKELVILRKKIFFAIFTVAMIFLQFGLSFEAKATGSGGCSSPSMFDNPLGAGYCKITEILSLGTDWILGIVSSIIILVIIIGGIRYITSAGDEERLRGAKNMIFYAIIGLGLILISYAAVNELTGVLGGA